VTSDGGLLLVPELDERLGLSELISEDVRDDRVVLPGCQCCRDKCKGEDGNLGGQFLAVLEGVLSRCAL